jgi:hypothetical protein
MTTNQHVNKEQTQPNKHEWKHMYTHAHSHVAQISTFMIPT